MWLLIVVSVLFCLLILFGIMRTAGDADRESEEIYNKVKKESEDKEQRSKE